MQEISHPVFFPVTQSLLSVESLISEVLSEYAIERVVECKLLTHNLNDNYLVSTTDNKYILRIYQAPRAVGQSWRTESDILYELDLLLHLHHKGVSVSIPIVRKDGTFVRILHAPEGPRPSVLFTYALGEPVTPPKQNSTLSMLYGRTIADIHAASDDFVSLHPRFHLDLAFLLNTPLRTIEPLLVHRTDDWKYLLQLAYMLKERIAVFSTQSPNVGACHGDAQGGNAHITAEQMITFFDFDVCGRSWRAYDLAVFYWGAALGKHRLGRSNEEIESLWAAYLQGYLERRSLSELDLQAIPIFVALRHFWFLGLQTANWEYWGWGEVNDSFFDQELTFLREWVVQKIEYT